MTADPVALSRRSLAERIQQFLDDPARAGKELTPWQILHTATALRLLELEIYSEGEEALSKAAQERAPDDGARKRPMAVKMVTTAEFKERLSLLMAR